MGTIKMITREVVFVADIILDDSRPEEWNLGTEHKIGGAEQDDATMLYYLGEVTKVKTADLRSIEPEKSYIISNFYTLPEGIRSKLLKYKNYILYEHDHHYCKTRNPAMFSGLKVPIELLENIDLFENARAVICMSKLHKSIVDRNVKANTASIGTSFWYPDEFKFFRLINKSPKKQNIAGIYANPSPHKGLVQAIEYCKSHSIPYELVPNKERRLDFLTLLGSCSHFLFLPQSPETCSRITVEAKMMGCIAIVNPLVGVYHEDIMPLNSDNLIDTLINKSIPNAVNIIKSYL